MWILWCKTIPELLLKNLLHSLHLYDLDRVDFLVLHESGTAREGFATLTTHIGSHSCVNSQVEEAAGVVDKAFPALTGLHSPVDPLVHEKIGAVAEEFPTLEALRPFAHADLPVLLHQRVLAAEGLLTLTCVRSHSHVDDPVPCRRGFAAEGFPTVAAHVGPSA